MSNLVALVDGLGRYVVTWSWQLAILVAFLWLVLLLDRRHRPDLRHRVLTLTLVLSFLLPFVTKTVAAVRWTSRVKEVWLEPATGRATASPKAPVVSQPPVREIQSSALAATRTAAVAASGRVFPALGLLWCTGIAFAATRKLRHHRRLAEVVRRAQVARIEGLRNPDSPVTFLSAEVSGPMLYGWLRPVILLPVNILEWSTAAERATIIEHECVHIRRRDHWVSMLEGILRSVLFFHPMVRWMCRELDVERELACDDTVLRMGPNPDSYADTLLLVARHAVASESGVHFAAAAQLTRRIEFLFRTSRTNRIVLLTVPLILLLPLVTLGFVEAKAATIPPPGEEWLSRFVLPVPPWRSEVRVAAAARRSTQQPVAVAPPQNEPPSPITRQALGIRSTLTILQGQGEVNEVRVTLGLSYADLNFMQSTTAAGTTFLQADGVVEGSITALNGTVVGRLDNPFNVTVLSSQFRPDGMAVLQEPFLLRPGAYRLFVGLRDTANPNFKVTLDRRFEVPVIPRDTVSTSSLVLADMIESGPPRNQTFRFGNIRVRPSVTGKFRRDQDLNLFLQVYSDSTTALVLEILITRDGQETMRTSEEVQKGTEVAVTKKISLAAFDPGSYQIQTTVTDPATGRKAVSSGQFVVE